MDPRSRPVAEITTKARRIGGSLFIPVPAQVARDEGIADGKTVRVVVMTPERRGREMLGLFPQAKAFRRSERLWDE